MRLLLKAIRTVLTDAALNALVPIADITGIYSEEAANYPCIALELGGMGRIPGIVGLNEVGLSVRIFSATSLQNTSDIYAEVHSLLHNKEQNITTADRLIHAIYETRVETLRDRVNDVWEIRVEYRILYSTASIIATTAADGKIYSDETNVTADSGKKIADFLGEVRIELSFESQERNDAERFSKEIHWSRGRGLIIIEQVIFAPNSLYKLFDIIQNATDTLADDSTSATSYSLAQRSSPRYVQLLFRFTRTDDGKIIEVEADKVVCTVTQIPFPKSELAIERCEFLCLGDSNDNVLKISEEN